LCFIGLFFIWFIFREMIQLLLSVNRLIYFEHNACPTTGGLHFAKLALFKVKMYALRRTEVITSSSEYELFIFL